MRIIAVADLHGKAPDLSSEEFDLIIGVGDYCKFSDIRRMIFKYGDRWASRLGKKKAESMKKSAFDSGRRVVGYLASFGRPVLLIPGNTDFYRETGRYTYRRMIRMKGVVDINHEAVGLGDVFVVGYGGTSGPESPEVDLEGFELLYSYYASIMESVDPRRTVFVSHVPPFGSGLDLISNRKSPLSGYHVGSVLVREIIRDFRPKLVVSGHVHESHGRKRMGKTTVINIGPAFEGRYLKIYSGRKIVSRLMKSRAVAP